MAPYGTSDLHKYLGENTLIIILSIEYPGAVLILMQGESEGATLAPSGFIPLPSGIPPLPSGKKAFPSFHERSNIL